MHRWLSVLVVVVGAVGISACGGDGNGNPFNGTGGFGGDPLKCSAFDPEPPGCDEPCGSDSECQTGTFCFNGLCSAQCTAAQGCGESYNCNSRGRCIPIFTGTGGNGGTGSGNGCQSVQVTPTRSVPNVMFLVDQSGSMDEGFGGGENRWQAAHTAINTIVSDPLDDIVRFGLTTYTSDNGDDNPPCPKLPTQVDFDLDNSASFVDNANVYPYDYPGSENNDPTWGGNDTPTGDSIDALVSLIQSSPPPNEGPTIIVLATDGLPDSCECPDSGHPGCAGSTSPQVEAVDATTAAHAAGFDVFALWVGDLDDNPNDPTRSHMQDVANAGVDGTGAVYVGDNPTALSTAFQAIISDSISCDIEIDKPFDDKEKACNDPESNVQLNGTPLSCPDDWRVKPGVDNVIELVGAACDTFKSGAATFSAVFPCGAIVVE